MLNRIPGTKDILPDEAQVWQKIEETGRKIFSSYNYREIRTPIIEQAGLFNRTLGETTEIVQKQMFLIPHAQECYALRPEGTASIARAYIENHLDKSGGFLKLYYLGPMFRLERPQKGRLRQFHHLGCEAIGSKDAQIDIEIIALAEAILLGLGIKGYTLELNTLGCAKDKKGLKELLGEKLKNKLQQLCPECIQRHERNILRILDCKNKTCQGIVSGLGIAYNHLCPDCLGHFELVKSGLDLLGIKYRINPLLVRGLDYYNRTVFEIKHPGLGSQDAIGAGGRYDRLIHELGGPDTPATGFAFGIERLLLLMDDAQAPAAGGLVYMVALGEAAKKETMRIIFDLRRQGICADMDYHARSLKASLRHASSINAKYAALIGDDELKKETVTLKNMFSGEQQEIKIKDLARILQEDTQCCARTPAGN